MRTMLSRSITAPARQALRRSAITTRTTILATRHLCTRQPLPRRHPIHLSRPSHPFSHAPQTRSLTSEVRSALTTATQSSPVVLFMKGTPETPQCGFSRTSIQILGLQGVDPAKFTAFNVLEDEDLRQGIKEFSNWPTIPQLYVDGEFVGGCDILVSMHKDGSLAELLEGKGVLVPAEGEGEEGEGAVQEKKE